MNNTIYVCVTDTSISNLQNTVTLTIKQLTHASKERLQTIFRKKNTFEIKKINKSFAILEKNN